MIQNPQPKAGLDPNKSSSKTRVVATSGHDALAGDVRSIVRGEERHHAADLIGLTHPLDEDIAAKLFLEHFILANGGGESGSNDAGTYGVGTNVQRSALRGDCLGQSKEGGL